MAEPVRIALIGCGRIARVAHLPALEKATDVELVALSDPSLVAEAVARRYDVPGVFGDANAVFAETEVEAVIVASPDRFRAQLSSAPLAAGKHVLVEKPMAACVEEASALVALLEEAGLTLQGACTGRSRGRRRRRTRDRARRRP